MRIIESQLRRIVRETIQDHLQTQNPNGMPTRKKKHLVKPGKYYVGVRVDMEMERFEIFQGPFDTRKDAYHAMRQGQMGGLGSYDSHSRFRLHYVIMGTSNGKAIMVKESGDTYAGELGTYGDEIPPSNIFFSI